MGGTLRRGHSPARFRLPASVDHERSTASYKQGLLTLTFPKCDGTKPRQILIESQEAPVRLLVDVSESRCAGESSGRRFRQCGSFGGA